MIQNGDSGAVAADEQVQVILGKFLHRQAIQGAQLGDKPSNWSWRFQ